jgi:RNA-binding protein NOB1
MIGVLNVSKSVEEEIVEGDGDEDEFEEEETDDDEGEEDEDDDDDGWITPMNIKEKKRLMNSELEEEEQKPVKVACLTTDFAMQVNYTNCIWLQTCQVYFQISFQNVLRQMGLNVVSMDGLLIKETKTWILRCYACFRTTSIMDTKFCPKCGNRTLKRVSVTQNADGTQQIHISTRRRLTGKGKRFSLPAPKGGKHAVNPVLCADQHLPQQRQTRLAKKKTDALNPDYLAGK